MSNAEKWRKLAARCNEATEPYREIDAAICIAAGWPGPRRPYQTFQGPCINLRRSEDIDDDTIWLDWEDQAGEPWYDVAPLLTESIDSVRALIEETLPGWAYKFGTCSVSDDAWLVPDFNCPIHGARLTAEFGPVVPRSIWDAGIDVDRRPSGNMALAMCEAFCLAMAAVAEQKEGTK